MHIAKIILCQENHPKGLFAMNELKLTVRVLARQICRLLFVINERWLNPSND